MKSEAHMVFHTVAENFNHCLFHHLGATVSTASSTLSTTAPCTPLPTPDGEFFLQLAAAIHLYSYAVVATTHLTLHLCIDLQKSFYK